MMPDVEPGKGACRWFRYLAEGRSLQHHKGSRAGKDGTMQLSYGDDRAATLRLRQRDPRP
ncbi:hypothetical protein DMC47_04475 [Nostoc sp. 3335mG]|nr:hypothetical protein DMC47_04475 [Nostoc sp. 3335mG]